MKGIKLFLSLFISITALTGCSKDKDDKGDKKEGRVLLGSFFGQQKILKITNELGQPLADAEVMIGLKGELMKTSADGILEIPSTWLTAEPVTISARGHIRATYLARLPEAQTFVVRQALPVSKYELTGQTPGFQIVNGDGKIDFSFVMPTLKQEDLLRFDINMIISPEVDVITAAGQKMEIPSNVTLPKQKESYIIGVNLEKPKYRVYFDRPGRKNMFTSRGQFPFKKVVDDLRSGKQFYELINHFSVLGGSVRETDVTAPTQNFDIPITDMTFTQKMTVQNQQIGKDEVLLGAALSDYKGEMFPTDVKNLTAGGANALNVLAKSSAKVLSVLKRKNEVESIKGLGRLSAVLLDFQDGVSPSHYALQEDPRVMSPYYVQVRKVQPLKGVSELSTYAVLSSVKRETEKEIVHETLTTIWEVYAPGWVDQIEIPAWPSESAPSGDLRWSVALTGTTGASKVDQDLELGPSVMQAITHVTNASADF